MSFLKKQMEMKKEMNKKKINIKTRIVNLKSVSYQNKRNICIVYKKKHLYL